MPSAAQPAVTPRGDQRARARRTALILGLFAAALYLGFMAFLVLHSIA